MGRQALRDPLTSKHGRLLREDPKLQCNLKYISVRNFILTGAPEEIRTPDTQIRSLGPNERSSKILAGIGAMGHVSRSPQHGLMSAMGHQRTSCDVRNCVRFPPKADIPCSSQNARASLLAGETSLKRRQKFPVRPSREFRDKVLNLLEN
jgi:hypothetical protein